MTPPAATTASTNGRAPATRTAGSPTDTSPTGGGGVRPGDGMPSMMAYLTRVLKMPTVSRTWDTLAGQTRDENWSHEEYLAAVLQRQVADRESAGTTMRLPFGRWGETFSDDVVAAAMIDRLVHHAEVLTLTGDSYRTRARRDLFATDNRAAQS